MDTREGERGAESAAAVGGVRSRGEMPKLLIGALILIVVMVAVNAVLTQGPAKGAPNLTVIPGGKQAPPPSGGLGSIADLGFGAVPGRA